MSTFLIVDGSRLIDRVQLDRTPRTVLSFVWTAGAWAGIYCSICQCDTSQCRNRNWLDDSHILGSKISLCFDVFQTDSCSEFTTPDASTCRGVLLRPEHVSAIIPTNLTIMVNDMIAAQINLAICSFVASMSWQESRHLVPIITSSLDEFNFPHDINIEFGDTVSFFIS